MAVGIKEKLSSRAFGFMAVLLAVQPLLDVLSYFMQKSGMTAVTTAIRLIMLAVVSLYGFFISDAKKVYMILYAAVGGFWLLHCAGCFASGYESPVLDAGEYLKLVQFPLWTITFVTFFRKSENAYKKVFALLALNFILIIIIVAVSFLTEPVYTYEYPERGICIGVLGFFGVPNSQSAIVAVLVPALLAFAHTCPDRRKIPNILIFSVSCALGFGLLFLTGTRFTYFSGIIIAVCFIVAILLSGKRFINLAPLVLCLVLFALLRNFSPMYERQQMTSGSVSIYQEKSDAIMGEDKAFVYSAESGIPEEVLEKIERVYIEVYAVKGIYNNILLGDLIKDFGLERVMKAYSYTTSAAELYNDRRKKLVYLELVWEEKGTFAKLFGFEYAECYSPGGGIYDPENDIPPLKYYYGYIGAAAYLLFAAFFVIYAAAALFKDIRRFRKFLSAKLIAAAVSFGLVFAAALFSGQALRRPSLTVYLSISAAYVFYYVNSWNNEKKRLTDQKTVVMKKEI